MIVLETSRLTVRTFEPADLAALARLHRDGTAHRCVGTAEPHGRGRAESSIRRAGQQGAAPTQGTWAVVERASRAFVGECGLRELEGGPAVEVDCLIGSAHRGRGLATELLDALLCHGFTHLGLDRIVAVASPDDLASVRLMEKLSMRFAREGGYYGRDCLLYEIDRAEWEAAHPESAPEPDPLADDEE